MILIDDDIISAAQISETELKTEIALFLYSKGILSFGQARKMLGLESVAFEKLLVQQNIPSQYSLRDLESDLATLESLKTV
jgi:predicted HTH domain antitoxin